MDADFLLLHRMKHGDDQAIENFVRKYYPLILRYCQLHIQDLGYAERNPAADIEGHDACRKVCILAALAFGKHIYPEQVTTEGITNITLEDVAAADGFGYVIKLIGNTKKLANGKITASVRPTLVSRSNMLSGVDGVFNAVMVTGDQTGEVMFYGKGAGKEATASAVVADIIDAAQHLDTRKNLFWCDGNAAYVDNTTDSVIQLYVHIKPQDYEGLKVKFNEIFADLAVCYTFNEFQKEINFITEPMLYSEIDTKLKEFTDCEIKTLHILD